MRLSNRELRLKLIEEVRRSLIPVFRESGFDSTPLQPVETESELRHVFPLGRLKRFRKMDLEIVEVQFEKYDRPSFIINIGVIPAQGVILPWGAHVTQDDADTSCANPAYRLFSNSRRTKWFKIGLFSSKGSRSVEQTVDKAVQLSSEIETWFNSRFVGPHLRDVTSF